MKRLLAGLALAVLSACASQQDRATAASGARPPEGKGPAGTDFGYWNRDAEGSVDQQFRSFILNRYPTMDTGKIEKDLVADGFKCKDAPEAVPPTPILVCDRLYKEGEDVHAWSVEVVAKAPRARAQYTRVHIRDPNRNYNAKATKHN